MQVKQNCKQVFSHLQEHRAPSCIIRTWEDKCYCSSCPLFLLWALYAEHDALWCGIALWSVWDSCPWQCPLLTASPAFSLGAWGEEQESQDSVQVLLSNNENISVLLTLIFRTDSKQPHMSYWKENYLSKPTVCIHGKGISLVIPVVLSWNGQQGPVKVILCQ